MEELLRRRIKVFSDDDGGLGVVLGGLLLRSVHLSSAGDLVRFLSADLGRSFRDPLDLLRLLFLPLLGAIDASVHAAAANAAEWILFLVYLLLVAMGIDLGCSPGALVSALVISSLAVDYLLGYCFLAEAMVLTPPASLQ